MCSMLPAAPHPSIFHQLANMCHAHAQTNIYIQFSHFFRSSIQTMVPLAQLKSNNIRFFSCCEFSVCFFFLFVLFSLLFQTFKLSTEKDRKVRWKQTNKWCEEIKRKLTTRRFGKSAPPVLNDRQLIREWFNHLFPIINILVNVRFALTRCLRECLCLYAAKSQSTRRESESNVYHFTAYSTYSTAELAKRTTHRICWRTATAFGWRRRTTEPERVQGQGQSERTSKKKAQKYLQSKKKRKENEHVSFA